MPAPMSVRGSGSLPVQVETYEVDPVVAGTGRSGAASDAACVLGWSDRDALVSGWRVVSDAPGGRITRAVRAR